MENIANKIVGVVIVLLGIVLFLRVIGVIIIPPVPILSVIWPIGIILIGIALMYKTKGSVIILTVIALLIASLILSGEFLANAPKGVQRDITKEIGYDNEIQTLNVDIKYGAGTVNINGKSNGNLVLFSDVTTTTKDPTFEYTKTNQEGNLYMSRASQSIPPFQNIKDEWNLSLSNNVALNLDLDYGAAEMNIDLSNLRVNTLDINAGASDNEIIFSNHPTKVNIECGMSDFKFKIPKDVGVIINVETGMTSLSLPDFEQNDRTYVNKNYNENSTNNIEITIHSGMSDFSVETY